MSTHKCHYMLFPFILLLPHCPPMLPSLTDYLSSSHPHLLLFHSMNFIVFCFSLP